MARIFSTVARFNYGASFGNTLNLNADNVSGAYNVTGTSVSVTGSVTAPILYSTNLQNWGGGAAGSGTSGWFARFASDGSIIKTNYNNITLTEGNLNVTNGGTGATTGAIAKGNDTNGSARIIATTAATIPLTLTGSSGQTANLFVVQDTFAAANTIASISSTGAATFSAVTATTVTATTVNVKTIVSTAASTSTVPLTINLLSGQTANAITVNTVDYGNNTVTIDSAGNLALYGGISAPNAFVTAKGISAGTSGIASGSGIFYNTLISSYNDLGTITVGQAIPFSTYNINRFTTATAFTITAAVPPAGAYCSLIIVTSGTTTRTITFSTGFKTGTTTLATGTTSGKYFVLNYVSDGNNLIEMSRTAAI
jgi:hypothetical protein